MLGQLAVQLHRTSWRSNPLFDAGEHSRGILAAFWMQFWWDSWREFESKENEPSGQLLKTVCAISSAESLPSKRNSLVLPLTSIKRKLICEMERSKEISKLLQEASVAVRCRDAVEYREIRWRWKLAILEILAILGIFDNQKVANSIAEPYRTGPNRTERIRAARTNKEN